MFQSGFWVNLFVRRVFETRKITERHTFSYQSLTLSTIILSVTVEVYTAKCIFVYIYVFTYTIVNCCLNKYLNLHMECNIFI